MNTYELMNMDDKVKEFLSRKLFQEKVLLKDQLFYEAEVEGLNDESVAQGAITFLNVGLIDMMKFTLSYGATERDFKLNEDTYRRFAADCLVDIKYLDERAR